MNPSVTVQALSPFRAPSPAINVTMRATVDFPTAQIGYAVTAEPLTMRSIASAVAKRHGLSLEEIRGPGRTQGISTPRQEAMWLMVKAGRWSLPQIGRFLGDRDHTTILHGYRQHQRRVDADAATWAGLGKAGSA